jgi:hypothetical protein
VVIRMIGATAKVPTVGLHFEKCIGTQRGNVWTFLWEVRVGSAVTEDSKADGGRQDVPSNDQPSNSGGEPVPHLDT